MQLGKLLSDSELAWEIVFQGGKKNLKKFASISNSVDRSKISYQNMWMIEA